MKETILVLRLVLVITLLMTLAARATTPALSGHYAIKVTAVCQATATSGGEIFSKLLDANFDPGTGIVTVTGWETYGALVVPSGGTAGMTNAPLSYSSSYSNTATTFTSSGVTLSIVYGPIDGSGIAQSYVDDGPVTMFGMACDTWAVGLHE